ncbi:MAG: FtsX-like permease family protein [Erysipelotrichaceae bacterium]
MSQARNEITAGLQAINEQNNQLNALETSTNQQFASGFASLDQQTLEVSAQKTALEKQLADFTASLPALQQQVAGLQQRISTIDAQLAVESDPAIVEALKQEKTALSQELAALQATIDTTPAQLQAGINASQQGLVQLEQAKSNLQVQQKDAQTKISEGRTLLYNSQVALQEATITLNREEQTGLQELEKARLEIEKAKKEFSTLEAPEWIVLNREKNYSYMDYKMATSQMAAIAQVFPIFFILVAALVCLTTMTRMVEEQRGYIGTMKALGYGKVAIASKYMLYAAVAALLGSVLGAAIGMNVFPTIIYNVWRMMFEVPDVILTYDVGLIVLATLFFTGASLLVTFFAAQASLKESPALLMRPKAPTVGKRILLERVGFVWNRMSFIEKVTARNIFRYKKRFLMSVIGIAGCFALLLSGFGIRDSISGIVEKQFGTIQMYDGTVSLEKGITIAQEQEALDQIAQLDYVKQAHAITSLRTTVELAGKEQGVTLYSLDERFPEEDYFTFDSVHQREAAHVEAQGVLISEKMSKDLQVSSGDTLRFTYDKKTYEVVVVDVFENYLNHMMVMSDAYYQEVFETMPSKDSIVLQVEDAAFETQLSVQINDLENVNSVEFFTALKEGFANTVESLNLIVIVLIISAGLLAFVVLYNLTNVNISERMREIATIKVLGFYDKEVESYVYRENIVLTIIGSIAGIFLGIVFHRFIMEIVEQDSVIFGKTIMMLSYFYSFAITMLFAFLVNFAMRKNLKRINMIESLKSVE